MSATRFEPFTEFPTCLECGATRGRSEKFDVELCRGESQPGDFVTRGLPFPRGQECPLGDTKHFHTRCQFCKNVWAMETLSVDQPPA